MRETVIWQRLEGALVFVGALTIYAVGIRAGAQVFPWWAALLIFFAPDLSFAGYAAGPRIGAFAYNIVHVYALGVVVLALGLVLAMPVLAGLGALWLGHSGFDRMLGYGLKSSEGFGVTHLGRIGGGQTGKGQTGKGQTGKGDTGKGDTGKGH
ncbi:DUF4260 domain-containing protein [Acidimangrovimonas sediminis]|uniref:DUF4260 domain-containing protein n=1 Tax=Acidimangrovimonas sediminis TaxID=2056283 RepID=UPI000C7FBA57|nr:DUF4260 domain-containing protein [Acidimangrovimonas sediminis]